MRKVPAVLAVMALIALPILAAPKPTPTPAARVKQLEGRATKRLPATTPTPTAGPVAGTTTMNGSKSSSFKEGAPGTPTPRPLGIVEYKDGEDGVNRRGQAAPSTCAKLVNGKVEHYPCPPEGAPSTTPTATSGEKRYGGVQYQGGAGRAGVVGPSKSKEAAPPTCARLVNGKVEHYPCPDGAAEINNGGGVRPILNTNITSKEGAPVTPTPTVGPVSSRWDNHDGVSKRGPSDGREKQKGTSNSNADREKHPKIKSTTSNGSLKEGEGAPGTPSPTVGPAKAISLNSSRSNIYRQVPPTVTPTPASERHDTSKSSIQNFKAREQKPTVTPTKKGK